MIGPSGAGAPVLTAVAIVVPAHDEEARIGACIASLRAGAGELARLHPAVEVSVTVVLDRCTDRTAAAAVDAWAAVRLVTVDVANVGAARRAGVRRAVADLGGDPASVWLLNTDADCVVPLGWLTQHVELSATCDVVLGEVEPDAAEMSAASLALWWERHPIGRGSLHGANLGVRLDAYLDAGGFAEVVRQEDVLLVRSLRAVGASIAGGTRVTTSGRRAGRVPLGFADYLCGLDRELDGAR